MGKKYDNVKNIHNERFLHQRDLGKDYLSRAMLTQFFKQSNKPELPIVPKTEFMQSRIKTKGSESPESRTSLVTLMRTFLML